MALFGVTRYMGDDEDENKNGSSAQDILEKIHQQAALKKRKRESGSGLQRSPSDKPNEVIDSQEHEKKRKRKRSLEKESINDTKEDNIETEESSLTGREKHEKKSSKKKRKSINETTAQPHVDQTILNISSITSPLGASTPHDIPSKDKEKIKKKTKTNKLQNDTCLNESEYFTANSSIEGSELTSQSPKSVTKKKKQKQDVQEVPPGNQTFNSEKTKSNESAEDVEELVEGDSVLYEDRDQSAMSDVDDTYAEESLNQSRGELEDTYGEDSLDQQSHAEVGGFTVIGHVKNKRKEKVERVLPDWLAKPSVLTSNIRTNRVPFEAISGLDQDLFGILKENGIKDFFPVQGQVIPALLSSFDARLPHTLGRAGYRPCDLCCSAPTGSGKTLAYVLPIVQALRQRVVCRVRALAVLPVRDLAVQVYKVFSTYCTGSSLKVTLLVGQKTLAQEEQQLVKRGVAGSTHSLADIVVATPGRLVDHITKTADFHLTDLRFLVIDEADRMMEEFKQDWLSQLERAVYQQQGAFSNTGSGSRQQQGAFSITGSGSRKRPGALTASSSESFDIPLQKLLFSATLSQNPEKLQQMHLFQPKLITAVVDTPRPLGNKEGDEGEAQGGEAQGVETEAEVAKRSQDSPQKSGSRDKTESQKTPVKGDFVGKFTTPSGLTEYFIQSDVGEKPLVILHLLHTLKFRRILCFTNSVDATHKLYWLVKLVGGVEVKEYSSKLHPQKRAKMLHKFAAGKIDLLICSDAMARGMDVENVQCVISYETPPYLKTYIHRVGRTARAGKAGTAFTLLEKKQIAHFKRMLKEAGKTKLKEMKVRNSNLKPYVAAYRRALKEMPDVLKAERKTEQKEGQ